MKQSDILSFAINGVQMELKHKLDALDKLNDALDKLNEDIDMLRSNLKELQDEDNAHAEPAVGRPAGFVAEPFLKGCKP